jgi:O-acetylhomoserine (thiol)-lyase
MEPREFEPRGLGSMALHAGQQPDPTTGGRAVPIHQTTSFCFNSTEHAADLFALKEPGWIYTRLGNPTTDVFERRMAALEGGVGALALSSGQQALAVSLLNLLHAGEHVVAAAALYGGSLTLLGNTFARLGIDVRFVDATDPRNIAAAIRPNTRAVFIESLANPRNDVLDYRAIADVAHERGVPVVCDNTVLTPMLFRPLEHGIDVVIYSTTKFIGGHGTSIGGAIVDGGNFDWSKEPDKWPQFTRPDPSYGGTVFLEAGSDGAALLHHDVPDAMAARPGRGDEPVQRVPISPRYRDASPADAPALRKRPGRGRVPRVPPAGPLGELSRPALAPAS